MGSKSRTQNQRCGNYYVIGIERRKNPFGSRQNAQEYRGIFTFYYELMEGPNPTSH
ncbi:hypothetical protein LEP1GSC175_0583 [Leptospira santarosai str. HAI821]|uniref:Uncharacterized protein n=3 Tax=Leptospira santarosai TaxID=28183 RepID=M6USG3_9LEPT|nr:hypothetical protein [Leptospira santarosai]EKO33520.1 hypothetical protein LEP1GSC179_2629 [Leptospira santarosai str. MOR084]EKS08760.1 hypothetical protein LEP1GSC071_4071 [Leptospira santarosai str. JET]EMN21715.1 hypothetical protein LEP1GSC063_3792 [Leptospira santarosai serovar Arenal str. MAVJ 401]EMO15891.1 hypothetical protein LEP1GSC165_0602 [Leptospira santarosai str. CBC523]EMO32221.1 hypothetical protein LEP1GSC175_0583 [Leptospira santarosai str. HAI821]EMO43974.1 hypothetic